MNGVIGKTNFFLVAIIYTNLFVFFLAQIPALNSVISMISSRRNRDAVIMGSLIGVCSLFLIWYLFG